MIYGVERDKHMNANRESEYTMEGHFDQDALKIKSDAKRSRGEVIALSSRMYPQWHQETVSNLFAILALNTNWDSYGANRISSETADAVTSLLKDIMQARSPVPQVVPSASGSIQVEWHVADIDLEIEVESLSTINVFFSDEQNEDPEWEGEIKYDLSRLVHYVNLLTERSQ